MQQFAVLKTLPCAACVGRPEAPGVATMRCRKAQLENKVDQTGAGRFLPDTESENRPGRSYVISLDRQHL
jgi:hypothetical protein